MINIAHSPKVGLLLAAVLLTGCAGIQRSSTGVELPQQFRLPPNTTFTFLENKSGTIAIAGADGNIIVTDQTGATPIQITRDANSRMLRDRSGQEQQLYTLPIWSPDAKQLVVLETSARFPLTSTKSVARGVRALAQAAPGSVVSERTVFGPETRDITETTTFDEQPSSVTFNYGGSIVKSALYTVVPNGKSALKEILHSTEEVIDFADWSPTGDKIAVQLRTSFEGAKLTLIDADGDNPIDIASGEAVNWSWNPDGTTMIAQSLLSAGTAEEPPRTDIKVHATDNGELLATVASKSVVAVQSTRYSPDGQFMVVSQPRDGDPKNGFDLFVADRDGNLKQKLTEVDGPVSYAWSPAGARLAYIVRESTRNPSGPLRVLDVNTKQTQLLTGAPVYGFFWSPDGARIAAFGPVDVRTIDPNSNAITLVDANSQLPMLVQTITVDTKASRTLFYVEPSEDFFAFLLQFDRHSNAATIWSPNSRHFLVPISFPGSPDLVIETEASGSIAPRMVGEGSMATWSPK